ncbi:MAG: antitoxin Xre-like helix-turn-helix domain-containing protein [Asticcacaulis sp.]|uniref:antitoxin Xre-like helix-turn-helix domain-containing protein n=1 Tax=Asticcacaulis sp. TaxID=1872648 RepID=UPI003F7BE373
MAPTSAISTQAANTADWKVASGTAQLFQRSALERDSFVREGVPVGYVDSLADRLGESRSKLYVLLRIPRATAARKKSESARLSVDSSDRVIGFAKLIGQVETIIQESGDPEGFDAAQWLKGWISRPLAALGNRRPEEFMDTSDGREMISQILARSQTGAFS